MIQDIPHKRIAGIPLGGVPIATAVCLRAKCPMIIPRTEVKDHGMMKSIEGVYAPGDVVIVIDDLIVRGDSKIAAIAPLKEAGLVVEDVAVVLDRESNGAKILAGAGIHLHAALTLTEMLDILQQAQRLDADQRHIIDTWLTENS